MKEVGRLAKCRPDVLGYGEEGHLRSLVDYLLNDMGIGKVHYGIFCTGEAGQHDVCAVVFMWLGDCVLLR